MADQLIVVDGGERTVDGLIRDFPSLNIEYIRFYPPRLTKQRNAGVKALKSEITLVGYLDDDVVLEKDAIEILLNFWKQAGSEVGGTSFCIENENLNIRTPKINWFDRWFNYIFYIDRGKRGVLLKSGLNTSSYPLHGNTYVEWLCGGATVWRREIIEEYKFDENFGGHGYFDDLDYSFRVGQIYSLVIVADAKVKHFSPTRTPKEWYHIVKSDMVYNRYYFVKKHSKFSIPLFYLATIGLLLKAAMRSENGFSLEVWGYIVGLFNVVRGNLD
jgi:GT2 family glycosyltransferase